MMQFRTSDRPRFLHVAAVAAFAFAVPASAQDRAPTATVIAIPTFATAKTVDTEAGSTWALANQIADLITADLTSTNAFVIADSKKVRIPSYPEITAPSYPLWRGIGAKLLLSGFVNARSDGRLTIGCYVYDVQSSREVARQGFAVTPEDWRRAAHRCADAAYVKATGNVAIFDSRIAYVAESGRSESPTKRLAIMDFDGASHSFLTDPNSTVLTPAWSPRADRVAYTSYAGGKLHARIADIDSEADRPLVPGVEESFAPAFSPDGQTIALSVADGGNTDIVAVDSAGGYPRKLTTSLAIDTSPSFSPDGRNIVFVSDRSGSPQLYVMAADGSGQHRISFGPGVYGSPVWGAGDRIAFARTEGPLTRIGTMGADGSGEKLVTSGPDDERPAWSPDGSLVLFQHADAATKRNQLETVPADGGAARTVPTPQGASDPSWQERQE